MAHPCRSSSGDECLVFSWVFLGILVLVYVVPGRVSAMFLPAQQCAKAHHLSTKWSTRLDTMGPVMLRETSDQPILELFVRSTGRCQHATPQRRDTDLTFVLVPVRNIGEIIDSGVVKVLTREEDIIEVAGMGVGNRMA